MSNFDKRAVVLEDGERYLEVCYRIEDARKDGCKIITELLYHTPKMAVFKAEVMKGNEKLAEAYGSRMSKFEPYYLEHAETAAIGRALSDAGYNIFSYELSEDINDHKITMDDGNDYLNVAYRIAMFRKERPNSIITKKILSGPEAGSATVRVEIIDPRSNGEILAVGHAMRSYGDDERRRNFVECAETAAVGRALSILGYDLPPGEGNRFSGIEDPVDAPLFKEGDQEGPEVPKDSEAPETPETPEVPETPEENVSEKTNDMQAGANDQGAVKKEEAPADGIGPEEFVIPSGKKKGLLLGAVWAEDFAYVRRIAYDPQATKAVEPDYIENAKKLCQKYGVNSLTDEPAAKENPDENINSISRYIVPAGKYKDKTLGFMWNSDWKNVRKIAYDPQISKVVGKEFSGKCQKLCAAFGIMSLTDEPDSMDPEDEDESLPEGGRSYEEMDRELFQNPQAQPPKAGKSGNEELGKTVINFGLTHAKETLEEVYQNDPTYVEWLFKDSNAPEKLKKATRDFLASLK